MIVVSELPVKEKFLLIKSFYPDWHVAGQEGFLYPLITALIYIFIYPFITKIVVNFYRHHQILLANSIKQIKNERLLTQEEATLLQRRHEKVLNKVMENETGLQLELKRVREALQSAEEEIISFQTNINENNPVEEFSANESHSIIKGVISPEGVLNSSLTNPQSELVVLDSPISDLNEASSSLTKLQLIILSTLSDGDWFTVDTLISKTKIKKLYVDTSLDILQSLGLIRRSTSGKYILDSRGRQVLNTYIRQGKWAL